MSAASVVIRPSGDRALLAECDDLDAVLALAPRLERSRPPGIVDLVPAARTVLVVFDPAVVAVETVAAWVTAEAEAAASAATASAASLDGAESPHAPSATGETIIDVSYDGADLGEVAELLGVPADEVVRRHTESAWRVAFGGFAPGFAYLVTDHDGLVVPRRASPRTRVPAGAVGLAGPFSGVYPRESPGGWQLIGRTDAVLFDESAASPALLVPGATVRFRSVG